MRVWPTIWDIPPEISQKLGVEQPVFSEYNALRFHKPFTYSCFQGFDYNLEMCHACIKIKSQAQASDEPSEKVTWPNIHEQLYSASGFKWPPQWSHPDFSPRQSECIYYAS